MRRRDAGSQGLLADGERAFQQRKRPGRQALFEIHGREFSQCDSDKRVVRATYAGVDRDGAILFLLRTVIVAKAGIDLRQT